MLTTFGYTVLAFLREKWLLLWALAFPVVLATLFSVMFSGIEEIETFDAPQVAVVVDDNYFAAPGFAQTMEAVSDGTLPGSRREAGQGSGDALPAWAAGKSGVLGAGATGETEKNPASGEGQAAERAITSEEGDRADSAAATSSAEATQTVQKEKASWGDQKGKAVQTAQATQATSASASSDDQAVLIGLPVSSTQEALALVAEGEAKGYISVDDEGLPGYYFAPGTSDDVDSSVVKAVLDSYVHGVAEIKLVARTNPLAMLDLATYRAFLGQDAVGTEQISVTRGNPDPAVRYYYALLGMAAGMAAQISAVAVGRLRADSSAVGARRAVSGTSPWKQLACVLLASWVCAFVCLTLACAYMRFVLGIDFGGRDALCLAALAVASFMACAAGGAAGACVKKPTGLLTGLTCFLALFAGLYGQPAMQLADQVAQAAPWASAINPIWQCARAFYDLLYYDSLEPFAQTCAVLAGMGVVFLAVAVLRMRRRYEHL